MVKKERLWLPPLVEPLECLELSVLVDQGKGTHYNLRIKPAEQKCRKRKNYDLGGIICVIRFSID